MSLATDTRCEHTSHPVSLKRARRLNPRLAFLAAAIVANACLLSFPGVALAQRPQAAADFDGDGVEDLAIGAPGTKSVAIFLGVRGVGFQTNTPSYTLFGETQDKEFGAAVAAADLDDNGRSELIVGVPGFANGTGKVKVFEVRSQGNAVFAADSVSLYQGWRALTDTLGSSDYTLLEYVEGTDQEGKRFGATLAVGYFDDDGFADFAVGVPGYDFKGYEDAGAIHIFYGGPRSMWWLDLDRDRVWSIGRAGDTWPRHAGARVGSSLAMGDFNGDRRDDLAIGAPYHDYAGVSDMGFVHVLLGSYGGLSVVSSRVGYKPAGAGGLFGFALAAGDFDRDGIDDLAIGAPAPGLGAPGHVVVCYGIVNCAASRVRAIGPNETDVIQPGARFGWALAAADFTGDGYADLAVGAPLHTVGSAGAAGAVVVFYGGERNYFDPPHVFHQDSYGVRDRSERRDWFGTALTAGDFTGDGLADLGIGVSGEDIGSTVVVPDAGAVAVLTGAPGVLTASPNFFLVAATRTARAGFGAALSR